MIINCGRCSVWLIDWSKSFCGGDSNNSCLLFFLVLWVAETATLSWLYYHVTRESGSPGVCGQTMMIQRIALRPSLYFQDWRIEGFSANLINKTTCDMWYADMIRVPLYLIDDLLCWHCDANTLYTCGCIKIITGLLLRVGSTRNHEVGDHR